MSPPYLRPPHISFYSSSLSLSFGEIPNFFGAERFDGAVVEALAILVVCLGCHLSQGYYLITPNPFVVVVPGDSVSLPVPAGQFTTARK
jgi:hypothetical protein